MSNDTLSSYGRVYDDTETQTLYPHQYPAVGLPAGGLRRDNALWYRVWVGPDDYSRNHYLGWVNGANICTGGTCTFAVPGVIPAGNYEFWLQSWNPAGMTTWAEMTSFSIAP